MYENLVKLARHCTEKDACINCPIDGCEGPTGIMNKLANAIEELLKAAKDMHKWIFLNSIDEQVSYDKCGLTAEMNAALGYRGQCIIKPQKYEEAAQVKTDTDMKPVKHAHWVKRMEHGVGKGYEVHTPIWSCSSCGRDYDPASCSIVKYCYICGARMDGGQSE